MSKTRRIIFIAYEGAEILDIAGPAAVFSTANALRSQALYEVIVAAMTVGLLSVTEREHNPPDLQTSDFLGSD